MFVTYVGNEYSLEMPLDEIVQNEFKKSGLYKFKPETCLMIKIIIDASEIPQLKLKLENLGYNYSRIFPGYNGIAKQMIESSDDSR